MDDDTRRALRELAEIARIGDSGRDNARIDRLLVTLADPPATPVATSDDLPWLDVEAITEMVAGAYDSDGLSAWTPAGQDAFRHASRKIAREVVRQYEARERDTSNNAEINRHAVESLEARAENPWPDDPDPEWRDVPAERAELRTVRVGDRWWDSTCGPWNTATHEPMTSVLVGHLRWIKRHDHPARKRGQTPPSASSAPGATPADTRMAPSGGDSGRSEEPIAVAAGPFVAVRWYGTVHSQHAGSDRAASSLANAINRAHAERVEGLREQLATAEKECDAWKMRAERVEREMSTAFSLPPTIGLQDGEAERVVTALRAERDELRARIEAAMAPLTADLPRDVMACRAIVALTKGEGR